MLLFFLGIGGSFLNQSYSRTVTARNYAGDMSLVLKDATAVNQISLFKASAMTPIRDQQQDKNQTHAEMDFSMNGSVRMQAVELDNLSTYVRLEQVTRNPEQLKKVVPRFASAELPLSRSLMCDKFHVISDAGLFHNRQSRVGWGPDLQYLDITHTARLSLAMMKTSDFKQAIKSTSDNDDLFSVNSKNPYVVLLATYLNNTKSTLVDDVPTLSPVSGSDAVCSLKAATENLLNKLKSSGDSKALSLLNYMLKVWNLCIALWGPLEVEPGSHAETMARKERLTHWLEEATTETNITGLQDEEEVLN